MIERSFILLVFMFSKIFKHEYIRDYSNRNTTIRFRE